MKDFATTCIEKLYKVGAWISTDKIQPMPFLVLTENIQDFTFPDIGNVRPCNSPACVSGCELFLMRINGRLGEVQEHTKNVFVGVCLDCYKAKYKLGGTCRYHPVEEE